jgi:hypothetical protein
VTKTVPLAVVHDETSVRGGLSIGPKERRFAEEYFSGDHAGNATRSYLAVNPDATYDRASVEASILLKSDRVRRYLAELHERITAATAGSLKEWSDLLPIAQEVILQTVQGRVRNRLAFEAAVYLTNRTLGSPTASHELVVRDMDRIARGVEAFSQRLSQGKRMQLNRGEKHDAVR